MAKVRHERSKAFIISLLKNYTTQAFILMLKFINVTSLKLTANLLANFFCTAPIQIILLISHKVIHDQINRLNHIQDNNNLLGLLLKKFKPNFRLNAIKQIGLFN